MRLRILLAAAVAISASTVARADTTYTYTGDNFTTINGPLYTTSDSVSGWFTTVSPLGDNLANDMINPVSFSFSDGVQKITNLSFNPTFTFFKVSTDSSGDLTNWKIEVVPLNNESSSIYTVNWLLPTYNAVDGAYYVEASDYVDSAFTSLDSVGTWTTTTPTPEPAGLILVGTGFLGLAGLSSLGLRSKKRSLPSCGSL